MKRNYKNVIKSIKHLETLHNTFLKEENYSYLKDYQIYKENSKKLSDILSTSGVELYDQLYNLKSRQMILADIIEYIFLARGFFFIVDGTNRPEIKNERKKLFIKVLLYFVNLLMSYESITVDNRLRKKYIQNLARTIPEVKNEDHYFDLLNFQGKVGLTKKESDAEDYLNKYFDKILPKTAGGLWHELLVYTFLLKYNLGYVIPLLLSQKFLSGTDILVPPDFLIITKNKNIYGIEVGIKKEIQSGSFSLLTNIPTATIDTINSRSSDRCPICHKWIHFCDHVIEEYSNIDNKSEVKSEIKCLDSCSYFEEEEILNGICPYSKYSRSSTRRINHKYTDSLHYHYKCVLDNLSETKKNNLISIKDVTAIKTHFPYYSGLETLFNKN